MSPEAQSLSLGGFKIRNHHSINTALFCELCHLLLFIPVQLLCCGTRLCQWCAERGLSDSQPFVCSFCQLAQAQKKILPDRAMEREMNTIPIECYACPWSGLFRDYTEHLSAHHADLECDDCHKHFFTTNSYEEHREVICEDRLVTCGLPNCIEMFKRCDLVFHCASDEHQLGLISFIKHVMSRKNQLPFPLNESSTSSRAIEEKALHDIRGAADHGLGAALILRDELVRIRSEHEQLQSTAMHSISYIRGTQKDLEVMDKKINDLQQSERETEKSFGDLTRKASTKTNLLLNDDCSIIFSFDNLTSAFSPIFKTADFGYPFVVRVGTTVNPDNQSESYLSIFISLLRGDYDPILAYPFKHNISFRLIDQSNQGKDLVSRLEVNPCSASFARPISEKNEEARIVNFCPLAQLTDPNSIYMKDGVYFVGVFIDFLASVP